MDREKYDGFADIDSGQILRQFYFLSKANLKAKFDFHTFVEDIMIEQNDGAYTAISTDGRRLHTVNISADICLIFGLVPGRWRLISAKPSRIQIAHLVNPTQEYPNWRKVLPEGEPVYRTTFSGFSLSSRMKGVSSIAFSKLMREFPELTPINIDYLSALRLGEEWDVEWYAKNKPVVFKKDNMSAIIMPMIGDN
jgi:hypothetical protein